MNERTPLNQAINLFLNSFLESTDINYYLRHNLIILKNRLQNKSMNDVERLITSYWENFLDIKGTKSVKKRGLFTTPKEIVSFIIQGVDNLLTTYFNRPKGILDSSISYFDPSCGPMTFPQGLMEYAKKKLWTFNFKHKDARNEFNEWFHNNFLPNMISFEILEEPYIVGYIEALILAQKLGALLNPTDHFKFYRGNTIIEIERKFPFSELTKQPLIVMGNPPYSVSSQTHSEWINELMSTYKSGLFERNVQPLSDDYVKFIRFAQWLIEKNGTGIIAFVTNNTWLDSRIFRVMRKELSQAFDHIFIVNLHGNVRKGEKGNPFEIMIGVCIAFFVRSNNQKNDKMNVQYRDIASQSKFEKLHELTKSFDIAQFIPLLFTSEHLFIPTKVNTPSFVRYQNFTPLNHLFERIVCGIKTHRDKFLVNSDKNQLQHSIRLFFENDQKLKEQGIYLHSTRDWDKDVVQKSEILDDALSDIIIESYRGFDNRFLCYNDKLVEPGCSRKDFMQNINKGNPAICITKQLLTGPFNHVFITNKPFDICFLSTNSKESAYGLILDYNGNSNFKMPNLPFKTGRREIFYYIYGILHSSLYRLRYEEYLIRNFPRIPFTIDESIFKAMSRLGEQLANIHLLMSLDLDPSRFPINKLEDYQISNFQYDQELRRIYFQTPEEGKVNSGNWIGNITPQMWDFRIGNIPQLKHWLKVRKSNKILQKNQANRSTSEIEMLNFQTICDAISKTLALLPKINEIYRKIDL
ncbi:MAG: type ISP restriction/modification enzyme [Candidatus Hodarchaeota archaeon]